MLSTEHCNSVNIEQQQVRHSCSHVSKYIAKFLKLLACMLATGPVHATVAAVVMALQNCLQETCARCKLHAIVLHTAGMVFLCRVTHCAM